MAKIRSLQEIQTKWTNVTPQRSAQYQSGVQAPKQDWATNAKAAEANFEQGVQQAIAQKSFGRGVSRAGTATWQDQTLKLGAQRWAPGVQAGGNNYAAGFSPFRDVIEKTTLPPRGPKGAPQNYARVQAIGEALNKAKTGV